MLELEDANKVDVVLLPEVLREGGGIRFSQSAYIIGYTTNSFNSDPEMELSLS